MKNSRPSVAIVIPTFNRSKFVQKAIDSSLAQTYPCEIIVCDHGSSDDTPQVMKKYGNKIKYIRRDEDFGPHFCWLDGILHAKSEFIHLQFDDDWIEKKYIEKCIKLMDDDVGVVISEVYKDLFGFRKIFKKSGVYPKEMIEKRLLMGSMYSPGASLFRKQDMIDALYQGNLPISKWNAYHGVGPDSFFTLLALLRYKKVGIITESLAVFRAHEDSITMSVHKDPKKYAQLRNAYENVMNYYTFLKWYPLFDKFKYFSPRFWFRTFFRIGRILLKKVGLLDFVKKMHWELTKLIR
jgi:glycosyltransferase involved in cell wall biosynthesis